MSIMSNSWYKWVHNQTVSNTSDIKNLEETLTIYHKRQKRMLYGMLLILVVIISDVLLRLN